MAARILGAAALVLLTISIACAQAADAEPGDAKNWRSTSSDADAASGRSGSITTTSARVSSGPGTLPNDHGQVWREYDISPYTSRLTTPARPQQAIIDRVLQETGYEAWHSEPLGILSATSKTLRVYHTPKMQAIVADLVDRFVTSEAENLTFSLRVLTLDHPNWRRQAQPLLTSVPVRTAGVSAWVLEKENAAMLLAELKRRSDYREHSSPHLMVNNGQSSFVSTGRPRTYLREVELTAGVWPGYKVNSGQIDEGLTLEFAPLLSTDGRSIDSVIKCDIDQVEKMVPVTIDVPSQASPRQTTQIEVPQLVHYRFQERFRWPVDQVLLVDFGMVAVPVPIEGATLIESLLPLGNAGRRANLLVFIETRGRSAPAAEVAREPRTATKSYHGRY